MRPVLKEGILSLYLEDNHEILKTEKCILSPCSVLHFLPFPRCSFLFEGYSLKLHLVVYASFYFQTFNIVLGEEWIVLHLFANPLL